ncbi:MAG: hypothetical protein AAF449_07295, partial [Myxococcota bacterium]
SVACKGPLPMMIMTSNSERRLPEPFLRRCIFHHIAFTDDLVRRAVKARGHDFPRLSKTVQEAAIDSSSSGARRFERSRPRRS